MKALIPFAVSVAIAVGDASLAQAKQLGQDAIQALFPGSFDVSFKHKTYFTVTAHANGTMTGKVAGITDRGTWSVRGRKLCIAFSRWNEGKTKCKDVFLEGGWIRSGTFYFRRR